MTVRPPAPAWRVRPRLVGGHLVGFACAACIGAWMASFAAVAVSWDAGTIGIVWGGLVIVLLALIGYGVAVFHPARNRLAAWYLTAVVLYLVGANLPIGAGIAFLVIATIALIATRHRMRHGWGDT